MTRSISNKMVTIKWRSPEQEDSFGDITGYAMTFGILGNETTLNVNITPNMNEYTLIDLGEYTYTLGCISTDLGIYTVLVESAALLFFVITCYIQLPPRTTHWFVYIYCSPLSNASVGR